MWKAIFKTTLLAGTLDILAAFISAYLINKATPDRVLNYIASGAFGSKAFAGGYAMIIMGLIFHFIIAFSCVMIFFLLYPKLKFLWRSHILNSVLIAMVAWLVTHLLIMPLSNVPQSSETVGGIIRAVLILVLCVGLPVSWAAKKYYRQKGINSSFFFFL